MFSLILCFFILVLFISNSETVIHGAETGLMLWYRNVIPVLLPFMILSNIIVSKIKNISLSNQTGKKAATYKLAVGTTFLLGLFCGYPLGAKTASDFVREGVYSPKLGNIILPVCNNSSPMFIAGYIVHTLLSGTVSFPFAMLMIYAPYLLFLTLAVVWHLCFTHHNQSIHYAEPGKYGNLSDGKNLRKRKQNTTSATTAVHDMMLDSIIQITYVGIYIMLCSVIIEFLHILPGISPMQTTLLSGITEITNGTYLLAVCTQFRAKIKTALILAVTSFGGISAILQTNKVISTSGLSLLSYVCVKILCATGTYILTILFI